MRDAASQINTGSCHESKLIKPIMTSRQQQWQHTTVWHTEHTSERTNTSELSHTYTHTQPDRDTLAEIPSPKMADRSSVGAPRRWPVRGNALYSSHFPSPRVIFSLFLWMFSPLAQLTCLSLLLCSPLRLIWQTRVREKSQSCTGHTSRCRAKTAALVEISFRLQVVWKINLQKISGNLLIKC